jgi:hypothetical protein
LGAYQDESVMSFCLTELSAVFALSQTESSQLHFTSLRKLHFVPIPQEFPTRGAISFSRCSTFSDLMEAPSRIDGEMPANQHRGLHKRIYILSDADFPLIIREFIKVQTGVIEHE